MGHISTSAQTEKKSEFERESSELVVRSLKIKKTGLQIGNNLFVWNFPTKMLSIYFWQNFKYHICVNDSCGLFVTCKKNNTI